MSLKPTNLSKVKDLLGVQGRNIKAIKSQTGVLKVGFWIAMTQQMWKLPENSEGWWNGDW